MTTATCTKCGAPWRSDLRGACGYCGGPGRPAAAGTGPGPGELDPTALCLALVSITAEGHPLDRLADVLREGLGDAAVHSRSKNGSVVQLDAAFRDYRMSATYDGREVRSELVHEVKGVVLKREELDLGSLLAELALIMAPMAATNPTLRNALLGLSAAP